MAALSNIPTTSRCRVDLYSGSAMQILPLSGEGKGALCRGQQGCVPEPQDTLTQGTPSSGSQGTKSAQKRPQVPPGTSQPPAPTSGISHLPPHQM